MSFDDATYRLVEDYLHNRLSKNEHDNFEEKLTSDNELKQLILEMQEMIQLFGKEGISKDYKVEDVEKRNLYKNYLESDESQQLTNLLEDISNNTSKKGSIIKMKNQFNFLRVAAAFVILAISIPLVLKLSTPNSGRLYTSNFHPPPIEWTEKGSINQNETDAQDAFNNRRYEEAQHHLQEILRIKPNDYEALLYLGITFQEQNLFKEASINYQKIIESGSLLKNEALWNMALIELKNKNYNQAIISLNHIKGDKYLETKVEILTKKLKRLQK